MLFRCLTILLNGVLFCASTVASGFAQQFQFQRELDTIPVIVNGVPVHSPFAGGFFEPKPTMADIDGDGDLDLFVGVNDGNIKFFRNTGTAASPLFTFVTEDFASIDIGTLSAPTFVDIDNDADLDLFVGELDGNINFYRNTGTSTNPIFTLETENFVSIDATRSIPSFTDIDNDGDLDLFVGETGGNINFYRNTGTASNPLYTFETENFAAINVGSFAAPTFADIDNDGDLDLFVGEGLFIGTINFFRNTGTATNPTFVLETDRFASFLDDGQTASTPFFADLDNDGDLDFFVGGWFFLYFYQNTGTAVNPTFTPISHNLVSIDAGRSSKPTFADINGDGVLDLFVGEFQGNILFYQNSGTALHPAFAFVTANFLSIDVGDNSKPTFVDIDKDGDLDLFIGERDGNINFYRNTGTASTAVFTLDTRNFASIDVGSLSDPTFADIDNDGDLDLFVGEQDGNINFYRNTDLTFTLVTTNFASTDVGDNSIPTFVDIDNDGDLDLFVGESDGNINFYRNTGAASNPVFTLETENFASIDVGFSSVPTFADIDNDSDLDLFIGESSGGLHFYRNITPTPLMPPTLISPPDGAVNQPTSLTLSWNPSTDATTYRLQVSTSSAFITTIFDDSTITTTSRQVGPLVNNTMYYWRVNVKNTVGTSAWSTVWSFTTIIAAPSVPTLVSPSDGAINQPTSLTLNWNRSTGATTYRLQVSTNSAFTTTVVDDSTLTITSRQLGPLANNTTYYWRVKAKNIGGTSDWSSIWRFTTVAVAPAAPLLASPLDGSTGVPTNPTLSWNPSSGATSYRLQVSTTPSFSTTVRDTSGITGTTLALSGFSVNTIYYWRVNASIAGGTSDWSSIWHFTTTTTAVSDRDKGIPTDFSLRQNYPNPFNPSTTIRYALPKTVYVKLTVFNPLGKEIETLVSKTQIAGEYEIQWNPNDLASGVYWYRIQAGRFVETKKMILMR